jgi:RNA polymerase primary sigma factor
MASRRNMFPATHEKGLEVYFRDINRYPLLSREEEAALAIRIRQDDEEALRHLVRANLRFVVSVAKRYSGQGLQLSDLINEGNLGLLKAARRFDESRGYRFISYAVWWIRQAIMQALLDKSRTVRLPQNQTALLIKINRTRSALQAEGIPNPDPGQIAQRLEVDEGDVKHALASDRVEMGLDDFGSDGEERPLRDTLADESAQAPDYDVLMRGLREDVRRALSVLNQREANVVIQYFGLSFEDAQTLQTIGSRMGLTRERIRQIKERALAKMRGSVGHELLYDYYQGEL